MKRFTQSRVLHGTPDEVLSLVTSETYLQRRYNDEQLLDFGLEIADDDTEHFTATIRRVVDTKGRVPGPARRLVGDSITVEQTNAWQCNGPPYHGATKATVPGVPGSIEADLRLEAVDDDKTLMTADGRVNVNVPLIGGQLAGFLVGVAENTFVKSMDTIEQVIAEDD